MHTSLTQELHSQRESETLVGERRLMQNEPYLSLTRKIWVSPFFVPCASANLIWSHLGKATTGFNKNRSQ